MAKTPAATLDQETGHITLANLAQVKAAREREDALFALYPHLNTTVNGRTVSETPMGIAIHAGVMYRHAMGTLNSNPNADTRYRATVAAENLAFAISTVWPDTHGQKAEIIDQWNEMTPGAPLADAVALWRLSRADDPLPAHAAVIMDALNHNLTPQADPQATTPSDPTATATYRAALGQAGYTFTTADVDTLADALIAAFGPTKDGVRRILVTAIESAYPGTDGPAVMAQWLSMSGDIGDAVNVLTTQTP